MNEYVQKLKDPRWQRIRLEIFERDGWQCKKCGAKGLTLHVHHLKYEKGKDPWEIDPEYLITLCWICHEEEREERWRLERELLDTLRQTGYFAEDVFHLNGILWDAAISNSPREVIDTIVRVLSPTN